MSSLAASEELTKRDEAALYAATAVAAGVALLAAGAGSGSVRVGFMGALLGCAGVFLSWYTLQWGWPSRLLLGLAAGGAAATSLQALIAWETSVEASHIYAAPGDIGLTMGLGMAVLLLAFTYLLLVREMLPFSLVPALTIFGLVGGRGSETVVITCFVVFLPAALAALGQAMLLSGAPPHTRSGHRQWRLARWRQWHWTTIGLLAAGIMLLAYLLFLPIARYATQYHWPLRRLLAPRGLTASRALTRAAEPETSYPVDRGPVTLADTPVFSVRGPAAELWRGEVFPIYTGRAWLKGASEPSAAWTMGDVIDLSGLVPLDPDAPVVTHQITAERDLPLVFHGAGQIHRVTLGPGFPTGSAAGLRADKYGCLISPGGVFHRGASYRVVSEPLVMGLRRRGAAAAASRGPAAEPAEETYLRVPLTSRRVADLARRVVGSADSPADKLAALVTYLQQNYVYALDAPAPPRGEDAADYFLFRQQRGYCDMFATSLAVMARAVGIPTRLALGYAGGKYDPQRERYLIRESDAHAWVEAYLPQWGWVSVDATPAGAPSPMPLFQRSTRQLRFFFHDHPVGGAALAAAALAALLAAVVLTRRLGGRDLRARARRDPRGAVLWAYDRFCRLLARRGRPRRSSQTPLEFLASLESPPPSPSRGRRWQPPADSLPPAHRLTEIFLRARYAPGPVTQATAGRALQRLADVQQALRRGGARQPA